MSNRSELIFSYDNQSHVVSAKCSLCNAEFPEPPGEVTLSEERVLWFAREFITHKMECHSTEAGSDADDIDT